MDVFKTWEKEFFDRGPEDPAKIFSWGHTKLWQIVSESEVLQELFERMDWVFQKREDEAWTTMHAGVPCVVKRTHDIQYGRRIDEHGEWNLPALYSDWNGLKKIRDVKADEIFVTRDEQRMPAVTRATAVEPSGYVDTKWLQCEKYVWNLYMRGQPLRHARQLKTALRSLSMPQIDAQRTLWEGIRQFAESLFGDTETDVLYDVDRDRLKPFPFNPFWHLRDEGVEEDGFAKKKGIAVMDIDFLSPDVQAAKRKDPASNVALREEIFRRFSAALDGECDARGPDGTFWVRQHCESAGQRELLKKYFTAAITEASIRRHWKP